MTSQRFKDRLPWFKRRALLFALTLKARFLPSPQRHNIVLSGEPRGGTTWVANILKETNNSVVLWEPLRMWAMDQYSPELRTTLGEIPHFVCDENVPAIVNSYFDGLFAGQIFTPALFVEQMTALKLRHLFTSGRHQLIKFCRANPALPYLTSRYNAKFIYLVRHPLAVISSQYNHPAFDDMTGQSNFLLKPRWDNTILRPYQEIIESIDSRDELFAAWWAFSNILPYRQIQEGTHQFLPVAYEKLYTSPEIEINRIFEFLDTPVPESVWSKLHRPSHTTVQQKNDTKNHLERWKGTFTLTRARRMMDIVHAIGVKAYDYDIEPDYTLLGYEDV